MTILLFSLPGSRTRSEHSHQHKDSCPSRFLGPSDLPHDVRTWLRRQRFLLRFSIPAWGGRAAVMWASTHPSTASPVPGSAQDSHSRVRFALRTVIILFFFFFSFFFQVLKRTRTTRALLSLWESRYWYFLNTTLAFKGPKEVFHRYMVYNKKLRFRHSHFREFWRNLEDTSPVIQGKLKDSLHITFLSF